MMANIEDIVHFRTVVLDKRKEGEIRLLSREMGELVFHV